MILKKLFVVLAIAGAGMGAGVARADSLEARIGALFASPLINTTPAPQVGVDVVEITPRGPVTLYSHNGTLPLGPASNCKLLTTSAAFEKYGPKAAFKTNLFKVGDDLVIIGGGDPGLGDSKLAKENNGRSTTIFEEWALKLAAAGITGYRDLIVDDRVFDTQWVHPHWPADQRLDWYSAPIGGLNFNANCLDWTPKLTAQGITVELMPETSYTPITIKATRGANTVVSLLRPAESNKFEMRGTLASSATTPYSVPIYDPGLWTGSVARDVFARAGVRSTGTVRRIGAGEQLAAGVLVATHETPLTSVIKRANTNSLNMMAEGLCKRLGYDATGKPGSWATGTAAVEAYVVSVGGKAEWVTLDDGSGLSNKNRVAAKAFTAVLSHVGGRADGEEFVASLAVPGQDGTLEKRFKGMAVAAHVHAKTGHITGVSTLSGYIEIGDPERPGAVGRRFAFSILCNKYQGNVNPWQDQVCEAIYQWASGK